MINIVAVSVYTIAVLVASFYYLKKRYKQDERYSWRDIINQNIGYLGLTGIILVGILCVEISYLLDVNTVSLPVIMKWSTLFWGIYLLAKVDYHEKKIPNKIILVLLGMRVPFLMYEIFIEIDYWNMTIIYPLLGALIGGGFMLIAMLISRNGIGMGDIKMFIVIGIYAGSTEIFATIYYTLLAAALGGVILLITKKAKLKDTIPMAPFAFVGVAIEYVLLLTRG